MFNRKSIFHPGPAIPASHVSWSRRVGMIKFPYSWDPSILIHGLKQTFLRVRTLVPSAGSILINWMSPELILNKYLMFVITCYNMYVYIIRIHIILYYSLYVGIPTSWVKQSNKNVVSKTPRNCVVLLHLNQLNGHGGNLTEELVDGLGFLLSVGIFWKLNKPSTSNSAIMISKETCIYIHINIHKCIYIYVNIYIYICT